MQQLPYNDADYAFGQVMLTLRSAIGLTQAAVAELLGVSRRAVVTWESGTRYPTPEHLKQFIILAVQHEAFPAGWGEEDIRALWRIARQKVLLDEVWLASLLRQYHVQAQPTASPPVTQTTDFALARAPSAGMPGGLRLTGVTHSRSQPSMGGNGNKGWCESACWRNAAGS